MKASILFARFPYGATEDYRGSNWMIETITQAKMDCRIGEVLHMEENDTPITMCRNKVMKRARDDGIDLVVMLDSDMVPDLPLPGARKFFPVALDFVLGHPGPSVVGAPYCGPPPHENIYVFQWRKFQSDHPNQDVKLEQYTREEAAIRVGFEEVAALPTGLVMIDVRCLEHIDPPWFEYEYEDPPYNTKKSTTEDVFFTRNLSLAGVPQYCLWDSWAGHVKKKVVGKPTLLTTDMVREGFREAIVSGRKSDEKLVDVCKANGFVPPRVVAAPVALVAGEGNGCEGQQVS